MLLIDVVLNGPKNGKHIFYLINLSFVISHKPISQKLKMIDWKSLKWFKTSTELISYTKKWYGISSIFRGDSSVLHCAYCNAHKNHVIRRISARAFREHGIVFHKIDQVKRYDCLWLMNEHGDLYFLFHNFGVQIVPFKLDKYQNLIEGKKRYG